MNHWSGWSALSADSLVATVDEAAADYRRRNQLPDDAPVHVVIPPRRTTPTDKRKRRIFRRRR